MKIRHLNKEEVEQAVCINNKNFSEYNFDEKIRQELDAMFNSNIKPPEYYVVENDDGKIVGFAGYAQSWMSYEIYDMIWVNIDPEHQGKGLGTKLVQKIIQAINEKDGAMIMLYCKDPEFYFKFGFKILSPLPDDYCVMGLRLR